MPSPQIKKHAVSIKDPITSLLEILPAIGPEPEVPWDATFFWKKQWRPSIHIRGGCLRVCKWQAIP